VAAFDVLEAVVGKADRSHEPAVRKLCHRAPCLLERNAGIVGPVQEVDVEVLAPETPQTVTARLQDLLALKPLPPPVNAAPSIAQTRAPLTCVFANRTAAA
jgi:hypothetical protein